MPIALLLLPVISTLLGGWLALRARRYLPLLLAVGAGLLLGTAFLDLLPEAMLMARSTGQHPGKVLAITLAAFLGFLAIESISDGIGRLKNQRAATRKTLGRVSGGLLILHSFRDGMVIGAAYSASRAVGLTVACGIVAHDIGDGMNTVLLSTAGEKPGPWDFAFLAADALAPFLGGLLTIWWVQSPENAVVLLALAAGFFLQMATSDFLPDLRAYASSRWYLMPLILLGATLIYVANWFIGLR
ncbi:MAG: zinc permease [Candidatus Korobacteraceae bacterium]